MGSTAIVRNTIPVGVGMCLNKIGKNNLVNCVFAWNAAVEEEVFHEAANFAVLHKLPVLLLCENIIYSVYSPFMFVNHPIDRSIMDRGMEWNPIVQMGIIPSKHHINISLDFEKIRSNTGPIFWNFSISIGRHFTVQIMIMRLDIVALKNTKGGKILIP